MTTTHEWSPDTLHDLEQTMGQLWPATEEEARRSLVEGMTLVANRSRLDPHEVFNAVVDVAEGGRSSLPNVGTIMRQIDDRRRAKHGQPARYDRAALAAPVATGPPWTAALWTAVFIVLGGRERFKRLSPDVQARLRPYCLMVHELNLLPEHNIPGPEWDGARVDLANERAEAIWNEHGGLGEDVALRIIAGVNHRGMRRHAA